MRPWHRWMLLVPLTLALAAPAWATPPPWAPAHGYRRKAHVVRHYEPAPFIYGGVTYIPLRNVTSLLGAALLWDDLKGRATITYDGRNIGLIVGSRSVYYDDEEELLPVAPLVVEDVVYVPATFCEHYLRVPMRHSRGRVEFEGPHGWHTYTVASAPPGRVRFAPARRAPERVYIRPRVERERIRVVEREPVRVRDRERVRGRTRELPGRDQLRAPEVRGRRERNRGEADHGQGRDRGGEERGRGNGDHGRGEGHGRGRGHGGD